MTDHFDDLLNEFLDGTISDVDESVLFGMMERESSLREEFVTAVRTHHASPLLGEASAPSASTTERIFADVARSRSAAASGWSFGGPLLLSIGALLVTGLVFVGGIEWERHVNTPLDPVSVVRRSGTSARPGTTSAIPPAMMSSSVEVSRPAPVRMEDATVHQDFRDVTASHRRHHADRPPLPAPQMITRMLSQQHSPAVLAEQPRARGTTSTPVPTLANSSVAQRMSAPMQLHVRTLQAIGASSSQVPTNDQTGLNNLAVDALYSLSDGVAVGFEVGRQSFLQEYQQSTGGVTEMVRQNPALFWVGPTVRYTLQDALADGLSPYGQLIAGISDGGMIGRALLGVAWCPDDRFSFTAGMEAGNLWYSANGSPQTSMQVNWSIGMGLAW